MGCFPHRIPGTAAHTNSVNFRNPSRSSQWLIVADSAELSQGFLRSLRDSSGLWWFGPSGLSSYSRGFWSSWILGFKGCWVECSFRFRLSGWLKLCFFQPLVADVTTPSARAWALQKTWASLWYVICKLELLLVGVELGVRKILDAELVRFERVPPARAESPQSF